VFHLCIVADVLTMHCMIVCLLLTHSAVLLHCAALQREQLPALEPHCPDKCSCSRYLKVVKCRNQRLRSVPNDIPHSVTELYLSHNLLTEIGRGAFQNLTNLTALSLEYNLIEKIADGSFLGLAKLRTLYLRENQLTMLSPEVFLDLCSLSYIYLSQNKLVHVPDMRNAQNVIYLALDNNNFESAFFPDGFRNLTRLSTVVLSNNPKLMQIKDVDFAALNRSTIRKIAVSRCGLMDIGNEAFNFPRLQSVVLSYNVGWNETFLRRVISLFVNCSELTSLDLSGVLTGSLPILPADIFNSLAAVPLKHLNLAHATDIAVIDNGTFQYFPALEKLDLRNSEFHIIQDTMSQMKKLKTLSLTYNAQLKLVPDLNLPSLQVFDISSCTSVQDLKPQIFLHLRNLSTLIMHNCGIHTIYKDAFCGLDKLKKLDLSHNQFGSSSLPVDLFDPLIQLTELNLSSNKLKQIVTEKDLFRNLKTLTTLDLSGNECSMIPEEIFNPLTSLTSLNLNQNCLGGSVISDINGSKLLRPLRALKQLMLVENNIYDLPVGFFDNLFSLQMVDLSNNQLGGWNGYAFNDSVNLSLIDFSSNKITVIPELSVIPLPSDVKLNLSDNPFACWCNLIWFRNWITSHNITDAKLPGLESYKCRSPLAMANKPLLNFDPKSIAKSCLPPPWIAITISVSCGIAVVIVILAVVCNKYRWPIRLKIYKMKKCMWRRHAYLRLDESEDNYVVYVSYGPSTADDNWVTNTLMPVIDEKERARHAQMMLQQNDGDNEGNLAAPNIREFHSVNTYWEKRDMLPGTSEIGSVAEAIYRSRKVMLVVSLEYLKDGRREFEIKMATEKSCRAHFQLEDIIIVLLDKDAGVRLPAELNGKIEDALQWTPDDPSGQELFWQRLQDLLHSDIRPQNV